MDRAAMLKEIKNTLLLLFFALLGYAIVGCWGVAIFPIVGFILLGFIKGTIKGLSRR
jgi:hypothetical protein